MVQTAAGAAETAATHPSPTSLTTRTGCHALVAVGVGLGVAMVCLRPSGMY
jgi:hypothetical protein